MAIETSSDFQCPDTGVPVVLIWNPYTGDITAEICDFVWEIWKEESDNPDVCEELKEETKEWCNKFYKYARNEYDAQDIAEKYDCWF